MKTKLSFLNLCFLIAVICFAGCNNSSDNVVSASSNKSANMKSGINDMIPHITFHVARDVSEGNYPVENAYVDIYDSTNTHVAYVGMTDSNGDALMLTNILATGNYTARAYTLLGGGPAHDLDGSQGFAHVNSSSSYEVDIEVFPVDQH